MSVKASRIVCAGLTVWLVTIGVIAAVVRIVDDDDPTADFSSIQPAIDASARGDIVSVRCGFYPENLVMKDGVSVLGQGPGCTVIDGGLFASVVTFLSARQAMEFSGFTVRNGRSPVGGGIFMNDSSPIIRRNHIMGNQAVQAGGYYGYGGGIAMYNSSPIISNNLIQGNAAGFTGGALDVNFSYPTIRSNTIIGNSASRPGDGLAYGGAIYALDSDPTIVSNVIFDNSSEAGGGGIDLVNSSFTTIEYNDTFQNVPLNINGAFTPGPGNISADPLPLTTGTPIWCPRSHSPVIDAGPPTGTLDLTDFLGRIRHLDGDYDGTARIDMGYCEGGDITEVGFASSEALTWDPSVNGAAVYNLYRGVLSVLVGSCATSCLYTQDPTVVSGARRQCGLTTPSATDTDVPPVGAAYFYLVSGEAVVEGILGFRQDGSIRDNPNPCP